MVSKVLRWKWNSWAALLILCFLFGNQRIASAEHLGLDKQIPPDIVSYNTHVSYEYHEHEGVFTANALAMIFDDGTWHYIMDGDDYGGSFDVSMTVNPTDGSPIAGTLSITGTIDDLADSGTLLTGDIRSFGFSDPPGGEIFEFLFAVTGGDLKSYYLESEHGPYIGVILNAWNSGFEGSFTASFSNSSSGTADTFAHVPEPSNLMAWSFLAPAGIAYAIYASRRRRQESA